jgi:ATP/maltotriose-dependent transcriptional regulator MalT
VAAVECGLTESYLHRLAKPPTVKTHLGHLFEKLGVTSRTEAVKVASRRGLVRLD